MLHTLPDDAWDNIQKIHVCAPFRLIRATAPYVRIEVRVSSSFLCTRCGAYPFRATRRTVPSSASLQLPVFTETLVRPTMLLPSPQLLALLKTSPRSDVLSVFIPTPSPSVSSILGLLPRTLPSDVSNSSNRLTQAKEGVLASRLMARRLPWVFQKLVPVPTNPVPRLKRPPPDSACSGCLTRRGRKRNVVISRLLILDDCFCF